MTHSAHRRVPATSNTLARVLWVGEAPGKHEVEAGIPFVGPSGEVVRKTLRWAGIDVEDVRFTNVVKHNPGTFPSGAAGAKLIMEYADELDHEMAEMPNLRVVVACGGIALRRLCGKDSIADWRGSVIRPKDLPDLLRLGPAGRQDFTRRVEAPQDVTYVPTLHPAGIMRGGWDEMILFRRDVRKVRAVLDGTLRRCDTRHHFNVPPEALLDAARDATWIYFDTEYHRESKQLYWFGCTFNGVDVFGVPWTPEYHDVIATLLGERLSLLKGAHNIAADLEALQLAGVKVHPPFYDTQVGFHTLYPTLLSRLNVAASYYIDDIRYWKDMDHHDPHYNALDVAYGAQCMIAEQREARQAGPDTEDEIAARMALIPTTYAMYKRGMLVDLGVRESLLKITAQELETRNGKIAEEVAPMWDRRIRNVLAKWQPLDGQITEVTQRFAGQCAKHPTYNGIRSMRAKTCAACAHIWAEAAPLRTWHATAIKEHSYLNKEVTRLQGGFKSTNPEHLNWLLYSPEAFHLPIQRHHRTKQPTTDATAIDKLSRLAYMRTPARAKALSVVQSIKRVQELEKARSTFISLERTIDKRKVSLIDGDGYVHPVYGRYTETGRMAGGDGEDDDKGMLSRVFYALNIPKQWRRLFVAPPGMIIISADWRNVEGRLTAHFSKDARYQAALDNELTGGPKVHSLNASIIFGCAPEDAERHVVTIGGIKQKAYDLGKRLTHAWSYGMGIDTMMRHFRISRKEAELIDAKLSDAYPTLVQWRRSLITRVLGVWEGNKCVEAGTRQLITPFGWRRYFMGVGYGQSNEVLAFLPQSSGGSMLVRALPQVEVQYPVMVAVHDSIAVITEASDGGMDGAVSCLHRAMSQKWPQLENRSFPISCEAGYNWGPARKDNPRGMTAL